LEEENDYLNNQVKSLQSELSNEIKQKVKELEKSAREQRTLTIENLSLKEVIKNIPH